MQLENEYCAWSATFIRENATWFAIIIHKNHQNKGIGRFLMQKILSENAHVSAWILPSETHLKSDGTVYKSPLEFYRKLGFNVDTNVTLEHKDLVFHKITFGI